MTTSTSRPVDRYVDLAPVERLRLLQLLLRAECERGQQATSKEQTRG